MGIAHPTFLGAMEAEVYFHKNIINNFMAYQYRIETNLFIAVICASRKFRKVFYNFRLLLSFLRSTLLLKQKHA